MITTKTPLSRQDMTSRCMNVFLNVMSEGCLRSYGRRILRRKTSMVSLAAAYRISPEGRNHKKH